MKTIMNYSLASIFFLLAATVGAHHSMPALFDTSRDVAVTGDVTEFEFIAPHGYIHLSVTDDSGDTVAWQLETYPPGMLMRKGLTPDTLAVGETVSAVGYPARDGRLLMRLLTITMPDGEERQIQ